MVFEEKLVKWMRNIKTLHSTHSIADRFMVSDDHARNILRRLEKQNAVTRLQRGQRVYWKCLLP